jgi:hypothetical protein
VSDDCGDPLFPFTPPFSPPAANSPHFFDLR